MQFDFVLQWCNNQIKEIVKSNMILPEQTLPAKKTSFKKMLSGLRYLVLSTVHKYLVFEVILSCYNYCQYWQW